MDSPQQMYADRNNSSVAPRSRGAAVSATSGGTSPPLTLCASPPPSLKVAKRAASAASAAATSASAASSGGPSPPTALRVKNFKAREERNGVELAELTSTEISLDLQGLIDDTSYGVGEENLFGDLVDAKKNELNHGYGLHHNARTSPTGSLGSSGHSSPTGVGGGGGGGGMNHDSPPDANYPNYRNALAYLPGSVHNGAVANGYQQHNSGPGAVAASSSSNSSASSSSSSAVSNSSLSGVQVKQEPVENGHGSVGAAGAGAGGDYAPRHHVLQPPQSHHGVHQTNASSFNNNNTSAYSNGTVSSTTPGMVITAFAGPSGNLGSVASAGGGPLPSLKSFATPPKYMQAGHGGGSGGGHVSKKRVDRNSDEYRRRRERNNVAVRKSREKAKVRTKDTEDRVKILARENERLQKKVELLQEELSVLRSLFSNVGVLPEHIHRELSKHMDNFQQQHNAMACM
jgi:hypothetical protein